jgi:hypothetical protein
VPPAGRARLRDFLNRAWAGAWPEPWAPLLAHGDEAMLPLVERAVVRLPVLAQDAVRREVCWLLNGHSTRGWTTPPVSLEGLRLVAIAGHVPEIEEIVHHEAGHVWCAPRVDRVRALPIAAHQQLLARAVAEGWQVEAAARRASEEEALVVLLERGWGAA